MPSRIRRVPEGRGLRKGPDAKVNQAESFALRRELIASDRGWSLSPLGEDVVWTGSSAGGGTSVAVTFAWLPRRRKQHAVVEARTNITSSAADTLYTALYRYTRLPTPRLLQIAGTQASFSAASTGVKTFTLPHEVIVSSETELFLGWVSGGLLGVSYGGALTGPQVWSTFVNTLPGSFEKSNLTRTSLEVPLVYYLSAEAKSLI